MSSPSYVPASGRLDLPTLPEMVWRISALIEDPDAGTAEVGAQLGEDPSLVAQVLVAANGSSRGISERCWTAQQACARLGLRAVRNIVVEAALLKEYARIEQRGHDIGAIWKHAPLVGAAAQMFVSAMQCSALPAPEEAYLAGLLHDVGKIVLLNNLGDRCVARDEHERGKAMHVDAAELQALWRSHDEVGASAVAAWGFSNEIRDAVLHHHLPPLGAVRPLNCAVFYANKIVECLSANDLTGAFDAATSVNLAALGITRARAVAIVEAIRARLAGSNAWSAELPAPLPASRASSSTARPREARANSLR